MAIRVSLWFDVVWVLALMSGLLVPITRTELGGCLADPSIDWSDHFDRLDGLVRGVKRCEHRTDHLLLAFRGRLEWIACVVESCPVIVAQGLISFQLAVKIVLPGHY